jgi:hypothetical protein
VCTSGVLVAEILNFRQHELRKRWLLAVPL